jgi:formate hydrogenlyase subunit 3/multisubunit Na+/H+ antiporter MnhD subunit
LKIVLTIIGTVLLIGGLLWIGQGTGVVKWPSSSFMIDQRPWIFRGVLLALVGIVVIWYSRRR